VSCLVLSNQVNAITKLLLNGEMMRGALLLVILGTVLKSVSGKICYKTTRNVGSI